MLTNSLGEEQWALLGHTAWLLGTLSVAFTLKICTGGCCSVAKLCLTLQPCGLQHTRLPCPPLSPRVCSNSCPLSQWCYLSISSSAAPFSFLPSIFPSLRVFSNELALRISWPNCCNYSFSISPSNEYSRLISFRIDWFDLLAIQETLKSLLQNHSSKASVLQCSAFFMVQLSQLCWRSLWTVPLSPQHPCTCHSVTMLLPFGYLTIPSLVRCLQALNEELTDAATSWCTSLNLDPMLCWRWKSVFGF